MKDSNSHILDLILNLTAILCSENSVGTFTAIQSKNEDVLIDELQNLTKQQFKDDVVKWIDWYKEGFNYSDAEEINMQFARVMMARRKVEKRRKQ